MSIALEADRLTKTYGAVCALDDFSIAIPAGGVFGVLGPNGAGKSTLFRIALGLVRPTTGAVRLSGAAPGDITALRKIGAMIETPRYPAYLTGRDTLKMLALESGAKNADTDGWLERVGIAHAADRSTAGYSVGMKQRLGLAAAFFTKPELVILDEPTSGMDPAGIQEIRALIVDLAKREGVTVILASHQLDEVRRVCERVAILSKGKVVAEGGVAELTAGEARLRITTTSPIAQVLAVLGAKGAADGADAVLADIRREDTPALIRALVEAGVEITEARWRDADLEGVYLRTLETEGAA
jgi:ABC-2 type transport system ATP-binding protein